MSIASLLAPPKNDAVVQMIAMIHAPRLLFAPDHCHSTPRGAHSICWEPRQIFVCISVLLARSSLTGPVLGCHRTTITLLSSFNLPATGFKNLCYLTLHVPGVVSHVLVDLKSPLTAAYSKAMLFYPSSPATPRDGPAPLDGVHPVLVSAPDKGLGKITMLSCSHIDRLCTSSSLLLSIAFRPRTSQCIKSNAHWISPPYLLAVLLAPLPLP